MAPRSSALMPAESRIFPNAAPGPIIGLERRLGLSLDKLADYAEGSNLYLIATASLIKPRGFIKVTSPIADGPRRH